MQIKITGKYCYVPPGMCMITKTDNVGKNVEELELSYTIDGNVKIINHFVNSMTIS